MAEERSLESYAPGPSAKWDSEDDSDTEATLEEPPVNMKALTQQERHVLSKKLQALVVWDEPAAIILSCKWRNVDVNVADATGLTALHTAAAEGKVRARVRLPHDPLPLLHTCTRSALSYGARMAATSGDSGGAGESAWSVWSSLECARAGLAGRRDGGVSQLSTLQALLDMGADVHVQDMHGAQPVHYAAGSGSTSKVAALCNAGADLDAVTHNGFTALCWAAQLGHLDVVRALVGPMMAITMSWPDNDDSPVPGAVALGLAMAKGHTAVVRELLLAGCDVAQKAMGFTALHVAVSQACDLPPRPSSPQGIRCQKRSGARRARFVDDLVRLKRKSGVASTFRAARFLASPPQYQRLGRTLTPPYRSLVPCPGAAGAADGGHGSHAGQGCEGVDARGSGGDGYDCGALCGGEGLCRCASRAAAVRSGPGEEGQVGAAAAACGGGHRPHGGGDGAGTGAARARTGTRYAATHGAALGGHGWPRRHGGGAGAARRQAALALEDGPHGAAPGGGEWTHLHGDVPLISFSHSLHLLHLGPTALPLYRKIFLLVDLMHYVKIFEDALRPGGWSVGRRRAARVHERQLLLPV